jgi:hypothetical protein
MMQRDFINVGNLTPDQRSSIEKAISEFAKINEPKPASSGLINVAFIMENEQFKKDEIKRIESANELYQQMVIETIKSDCDRIQGDLAQLGLKAFPQNCYIHALKDVTFVLVIAEKNYVEKNYYVKSTNPIGKVNIQYKLSYIESEVVKKHIFNGYSVVFNSSFYKGGFDECIQSKYVQDSIAKLYKDYTLK